MPMHTRTAVLAAVLSVVALTVCTAPAQAQEGAAQGKFAVARPAAAQTKAAPPAFLKASELPPHPSSDWIAGPVTDGFPAELAYCLGEGVPAYDYRHRVFHTDLDTGAAQVTVVAGSEAKGKALAALLNDEIRSCADRIEQSDPETEAEGRDYGSLPVEEGARVHGLHTTTSYGATDIHLLSVGRDGRTVTVVSWGQMGTFADAPLPAFRNTTTTAVKKLY
ncbi:MULTISPECIES: hypothetical protein [unclassified Streptomyces]|uniref:hypothetical protein n=1 Tax=unclassified Streptomyces TaxID=2593676 RepID=UPI00093B296D|nr:hypothetical protein [Streptomyces sp. CB02058]OKI97824.1 hypothetical protein AMK10_03070 [Streptomyces sp. CB02058]